MKLSLFAPVLCLLAHTGMAVDHSGRVELRQLPTAEDHPANIEDMVEDLARVGAKNGVTPGIDTFVKQIEKMVNEDMKPKVMASHDQAVLLVNGLVEPFNLCGNQKQQDDLGVTAAKTAREGRSAAHKACRISEGAALPIKQTCDGILESLKSAKDAQCNNPMYDEPPDAAVCHPTPGVSNELWVQSRAVFFSEKEAAFERVKADCDTNTGLVDQKQTECDARDAEYTSAKAACDVEQTNLESAACSQAAKTKGTCETYTTCYQNALTALNNAKPSIEAQVSDRKGEWRGLLRIQCLFGVFADGSGKGVDVAQIDACKAKTHDTSHLDIAFPVPPGQTPCAVTGSEPCTAAYTTEEYGGLPVNAQYQACVPCAWNAPTTTTTTTTGNGWHAILRYGTEAYTPTSSAVGNVESTVGFAKLSDAAINAISDGSGYQHYKLTSVTDSSVIYVRTSKSFSDTSRAFGWSGSFEVCNTVDLGSCSWKAVTLPRFDTETEFGNTCDRWFADYSSTIHCYATGSNTQRCFARGSPCGHDMRTNVVMYKFGLGQEESPVPPPPPPPPTPTPPPPPVLEYLGKDPTVALGMCQGDCDSNSDCQSGLACAKRTGACVVHGCSGTCHSDKTDYCVSAQGVLEYLGTNPTVSLGLCQGDCDNDSDCQSGLKCFQRKDKVSCSVPGCSGTCNSKNTDYCASA